MLEGVQQQLKTIVQELFDAEVVPHVAIPEEQFGDVASNVAMQIAKQVGKNPREVAQQLADALHDTYDEVSIAGPGFLNVRLSTDTVWKSSSEYDPQSFTLPKTALSGQRVVLEYSCPNWFKELHTGHLYQTIVGNALARMLEQAGATVHRTTFGGDVGQHVARAVWSILQDPGGYDQAKASDDPLQQAAFITGHYVLGSAAFEKGGDPQKEIKELNKKIYGFSRDTKDQSHEAVVYRTCRDWSTQYFHLSLIHIPSPRDA